MQAAECRVRNEREASELQAVDSWAESQGLNMALGTEVKRIVTERFHRLAEAEPALAVKQWLVASPGLTSPGIGLQ